MVITPTIPSLLLIHVHSSIFMNCTIFYHAGLVEYGWKRENGTLAVVWEMPENVEKAKASLNFVMSGCKCKTGCSTRRCSCQNKGRICGPSCQCINCTNNAHTKETDTADLEVEDLLNESGHDDYIEESEDDLEEMRMDKELVEIMDSVFGPESDEEII